MEHRGRVVARGEVLDLPRMRAETEARRQEIGEALERFAQTPSSTCARSASCWPARIELPRFTTDFRDRPAAGGRSRRRPPARPARAATPFIRDMHPVIVAVDGGAEAVLETGFVPDIIVGDMDSRGRGGAYWPRSQSSRSSSCTAIRRACPWATRLETLGLPFKLVPRPAPATEAWRC